MLRWLAAPTLLWSRQPTLIAQADNAAEGPITGRRGLVPSTPDGLADELDDLGRDRWSAGVGWAVHEHDPGRSYRQVVGIGVGASGWCLRPRGLRGDAGIAGKSGQGGVLLAGQVAGAAGAGAVGRRPRAVGRDYDLVVDAGEAAGADQ